MEYIDIFKSWIFYIFVAIFFLSNVFTHDGVLFFSEYQGILIGAFLITLFFATLIWALNKFSFWIKKKVTKR